MEIPYADLVKQTFDWPQSEYQTTDSSELLWNGIDLSKMIQRYGTPLKVTYLPVIGKKIRQARSWFQSSFETHNYSGNYHYCYVTKSSHFEFVLDQTVKHEAHIETSSAFDLDIVSRLLDRDKISPDHQVICNGFKNDRYIAALGKLTARGMHNILPIIDDAGEVERLASLDNPPSEIGIRIATEEEPKFEFYTSRLGMGYQSILPFYQNVLKDHPQFDLKMLHFFVNTGIRDNAYYWNELNKTLKVYCELKKVCPTLDSLNIGGGLPIKNSLAFDFDYAGLIDQIIVKIKDVCDEEGVPHPHIYTEFGSFTVGDAGANFYRILSQKKQNEKERWNMIDSSFMTTLPDTWAISKRFIMLPINNWDKPYERVFLGGLTCDSDDYYNSEQHVNAIYLPQFEKSKELVIGFFNTGAYQESLGGHGGVHHCLIPGPKHVLVDQDEKGDLIETVFSEEQTSDQMLSLLGY